MSNCRSGCPTGDHESWGACARAANLRIAYCNSASGQDYTKQKKWDAELDLYKQARSEGIQPAGTSRVQVESAMAASDKAGVAVGA